MKQANFASLNLFIGLSIYFPSDCLLSLFKTKNSMENLGRAISKVRRLRGITQIELAEMIGVTQGFISQIEKEIRNPTLDVLKKISEVLKVPTYVLFYLSESLQKEKTMQRSDNEGFFELLFENYDLLTDLIIKLSINNKPVEKSSGFPPSNKMKNLKENILSLKREIESLNSVKKKTDAEAIISN